MFEFIFSEQFLSSTILFAVPIIFATMAALITKKAGLLNINVEGSMSMAALTGGLVSFFTHNWILGLLSAVAAGILFGLVFAWFSLKFKTDPILAGISLNTMASGLAVYLLYVIVGVKGDSSSMPSVLIPDLHIPWLSDLPFVGPVLFSQNLLVYLAFLSVIALSVIINKTKLGAHIRATGSNQEAAASVGINVARIKVFAVIAGGILAGLGGAYLSMVYLSYFSGGMVAGRGFIGIAAEAISKGNPYAALLFSLFFGAIDYFAIGAQTVLGFPYELLNTLPYLMTMLALVIYAFIGKYRKKGNRMNE